MPRKKQKKKGGKISALDPGFKKKIEKLFEEIMDSIGLLYDTAIKDSKTGLYNAKFFDTLLEMEIDKSRRNNLPLSLFIIDIDYFKKINDKYGHMKADQLLIKLAHLLQDTLRKSDVVSRFGGEEFFILLPNTDLEKAKKLTSRLRSIIKKERTLKKYKLTVSGGLTQLKPKDNKKKIMDRADKALYKAKKTGRDKFAVAK